MPAPGDDEPTGEPRSRHRLLVLERVRALREQGYGIVFSTHDPDQAHDTRHPGPVIADGRLAAYGSPEETLTGEILSAVYGCRVMVAQRPAVAPWSSVSPRH